MPFFFLGVFHPLCIFNHIQNQQPHIIKSTNRTKPQSSSMTKIPHQLRYSTKTTNPQPCQCPSLDHRNRCLLESLMSKFQPQSSSMTKILCTWVVPLTLFNDIPFTYQKNIMFTHAPTLKFRTLTLHPILTRERFHLNTVVSYKLHSNVMN